MIFIVVRQTTDWNDETVFRAQLPAAFRPSVELWNASISLPYHLFRHELARIARATWERVEGASIAPLGDVPAGGIVVPTDDDDWFAPGLARTIDGSRQENAAGYYWHRDFIEVPISLGHRLGLLRKALFPSTPPKWICTTNNYAVVAGPEAPGLTRSHIEASRWFLAHPDRVVRLDAHLSVMNRSLASQTSFRAVRSRSAFVRKFHRYQRVYREVLPAELSWARPYHAMMAELMSDLRLR